MAHTVVVRHKAPLICCAITDPSPMQKAVFTIGAPRENPFSKLIAASALLVYKLRYFLIE